MTPNPIRNLFHSKHRRVHIFLLLIIGLLPCIKLSYQTYLFFQDRLIVENQYKETVSNLRVEFRGNSTRRLDFQNLENGTEQWKPCDPDWAISDSNRLIAVQGVTKNVKRIGSNENIFIDYSVGPWVGGKYIKITIQPDGKIATYSN